MILAPPDPKFLSELEIARAYLATQEKQIAGFSKNWRDHITPHEVPFGHYDWGLDDVEIDYEVFDSIEGISESDYDLELVFLERMPNFVRQSNLIMVWGILERGLASLVSDAELVLGRKAKSRKSCKAKGQSDLQVYLNQLRSLDVAKNPSVGFKKANTVLENYIRHIRVACAHHAGYDLKNKVSPKADLVGKDQNLILLTNAFMPAFFKVAFVYSNEIVRSYSDVVVAHRKAKNV